MCPLAKSVSFRFNSSIFVTYDKSVSSHAQFFVQDSLILPDLTLLQPEVVEKLVALREGIPRKDAKEVCKLN